MDKLNLFNKLINKNLGKTAIVISTRGHISRELIQTSNLYLSFDKLEEYIKRIP